jgi:hypothetical protein
LTVHRETLTQYGTLHLIEGGEGSLSLVLCSLATVLFCFDPSVKIVTKAPNAKVGPLLIFSISLGWEIGNSSVTYPHSLLR